MKHIVPKVVTHTGHSVDYLNTLSMRRLSKETSIPRHTLMYRINVMGLSVKDAVDHPKHQWRRSQYPTTS